MLRQARGQTSTQVGEQINCPIPIAHERPWTRPWWQPSRGNGPVLFYLVLIHALALVGLILFPLPGWSVLGVALAVASTDGVGTSVCSHRSLSHRALRLNRMMENILIFFAIFRKNAKRIAWLYPGEKGIV